jgi:hypothetical protein
MNGEHQSSEDDVIRVLARLEHVIEWQKQHDDKSELWRTSIDKRLEPVEDFVKGAGFVWKIILGFAALGAVCVKIWDSFKEHWK